MATKTKPTIHFFEEGEQVYPCRCGKTHRGPYGAYEYGHHNCFHSAPLRLFGREEGLSGFFCGECGLTFEVADGKD